MVENKEKKERGRQKCPAEEAAYRYWFHGAPKIPGRAKQHLMECLGSAKAVYQATDRQLKQLVCDEQAEWLKEWKKNFKVMENYEQIQSKGISMVSIWDQEYPQRLRKIQNPPLALYYLGSLPDERRTALAMIGARECSDYGSFVAKAFGTKLGASGINIISGMARGIDGISQEAALLAGGYTYAVLGCGVDICYPESNRELYQAIQENGGVLSPFFPGTKPQKSLFPYRNKIVAGLSDAVLVVEARQKSGTWITVDMALEQGKDVYAVPGRLTDRLSDGCNILIRQGAGIALAPEDVAAELAILKNRHGITEAGNIRLQKTRKGKKRENAREKEETPGSCKDSERLLKFLDLNPKSSDEILKQAREADMEITLSQLFFELIQLCMEGKARQTGGNYFSQKPDAAL